MLLDFKNWNKPVIKEKQSRAKSTTRHTLDCKYNQTFDELQLKIVQNINIINDKARIGLETNGTTFDHRLQYILTNIENILDELSDWHIVRDEWDIVGISASELFEECREEERSRSGCYVANYGDWFLGVEGEIIEIIYENQVIILDKLDKVRLIELHDAAGIDGTIIAAEVSIEAIEVFKTDHKTLSDSFEER